MRFLRNLAILYSYIVYQLQQVSYKSEYMILRVSKSIFAVVSSVTNSYLNAIHVRHQTAADIDAFKPACNVG